MVQILHLLQVLFTFEVDQQEAIGSILEQADSTLLLNDVHGGHHFVGRLVVLAGILEGGLFQRHLRRERREEDRRRGDKREERIEEEKDEKIKRNQ